MSADAIAHIALAIPDPATSGDILKALMRAYEAGKREGFNEGAQISARATAQTMSAVTRLLECNCND